MSDDTCPFCGGEEGVLKEAGVTTNDKVWIDGIATDYFIALFCDGNESDVAIARERFDHGIESLAQREYHRGYEDGRRAQCQ